MDYLQWDIATIANIIQIAVAPVFLLAGISGLLMVMTNRLGRIIDRSRKLRSKAADLQSDEHKLWINKETSILLKRMNAINIAISFATASAFMVCVLIITLFLGNLISSNFAQIVALLFILCMALLSIAFLFFFKEVFVAAKTMRKGLADIEALINK